MLQPESFTTALQERHLIDVMLCTSKVRVVKESAYMISDTRTHPILLTKELLFRLLHKDVSITLKTYGYHYLVTKLKQLRLWKTTFQHDCYHDARKPISIYAKGRHQLSDPSALGLHFCMNNSVSSVPIHTLSGKSACNFITIS